MKHDSVKLAVHHGHAARAQPVTRLRLALPWPESSGHRSKRAFDIVVSAVLLGRISAMRRDKQLVKLDPANRQDPATTTVQAVRPLSGCR